MEFEDLKPSEEAQEIGKKYLLGEISAEDAIQQIKEQAYKRLSLSTAKLNDITVKTKVKNGKVLLDKNNKDHRYVMDEKY